MIWATCWSTTEREEADRRGKRPRHVCRDKKNATFMCLTNLFRIPSTRIMKEREQFLGERWSLQCDASQASEKSTSQGTQDAPTDKRLAVNSCTFEGSTILPCSAAAFTEWLKARENLFDFYNKWLRIIKSGNSLRFHLGKSKSFNGN